MGRLTVVKVGGSLYDLPDLGPRLRHWLGVMVLLAPGPSPTRGEGRVSAGVLLVPGGGATAGVVRELDSLHELGEEASHWLALRALALNAHFLARLLPGARVVGWPADARGGVCVLDAHAFLTADEGRPGRLPHSWEVTSDSVAARAAALAGAGQLVLLKSANVPEDVDWAEAGRRGLVDRHFADALAGAPDDLQVRAVNLRAWPG